MTNKIVISGYYGFDNFGDEGILGILIKNLKSLGLDTDITVFSSNPDKTSKRYEVKSVHTFNLFKVINAINRADVLISGGGSLLQDVTSLKSLFYYLFVIFCAIFYNKKVIIFAQGIGPINNSFARLITRFLLKKVSYISVRDEKSLFLLRGWGLNPILTADPMWNTDLLSLEPKNRIGIQLREWRGLSDSFINALARNVNEFYSDKEIYIYSFQDSQDLEVCKRFQTFLCLLNNNVKTKIIYNRTNKEIIDSFRYLDTLIAMRYHACLIALKYGIKVLPLSYDEKVEKLAKEAGITYVEVSNAEGLETAFEKIPDIDTRNIQEKFVSKRFDFSPVFEIIEG